MCKMSKCMTFLYLAVKSALRSFGEKPKLALGLNIE